MSGKFITFEGNDGCGKTTISTRIYETLKNEDELEYEVVHSKGDKKVIIIYSPEEVPDNLIDILEDINKEMPTIKGNIRLK